MVDTVVYPGSFDPITLGHLDVIQRARALFPRVIVAVADNSEKRPIFTAAERLELIRTSAAGIPGVATDTFSGLLVDYLEKTGCFTILRGLRAVSDFDYEFQMLLTNRRLLPKVETIFLMPQEKFFFLSSSLIKELARMNADLRDFVPPSVERALKAKLAVKKA
ncbi:MAG: Phosphopantetheine adenylyltransferase [candidate division TA06 bacterium ADurb.Bin417]|uniref:Phosphopantetheine adenylyltransferase n=1 Tax=candidate division TA06 bacterium ADurb.Bin417 TaxID=1852828 RepID=A0A1V5MAN5_UNCT6|nr:MAG: Phosphopantetheine adenylyltransferase [candidate division TA06 bacterium ADurb.Bin417]